ncbi:hypothetical protein FBUS_00242 [Fasciolopsis buskii]|uniref:Uncharacterized protein n=1 Tax=Fasciolopsis buskii TaxID=27845 RepID=A0A8E0RZ34_9TREM|nr:hypothetical protein FBUS_00242 [Fasciolopsis buski]
MDVNSVPDTFDCIYKIKDANIRTKIMFLLDVESFFTNVPLLKIIDFIVDYIRQNDRNFGLPVNSLRELQL